jgi:ribosomal-protein-alanine N-acetyltransferase
MGQWPVRLSDGELELRPLARSDARAYAEVRAHNRDWLRPWEASYPNGQKVETDFKRVRSGLTRAARSGDFLPFALSVDGHFRGQLTVSGLQWGSICGASLGYWIDRRVAGRGLTPRAVALACDYCFLTLGLHRMEINIRPENAASLRVVEKLGFVYEGLRRGYMHIDGQWADHLSFALLATDVPGGLLTAYRRAGRAGG